MTPLVTLANLQAYKYIADSVKNTTSWGQFVSEAQMLDVKRQIGDALLDEIVTEFDAGAVSVANQTLLDGGSYVYNEKTYLFQGLSAAIIYYAFGRFTNRTSFNYTAAGIVLKESDFSTPISDKVMQRLETEARLTADAIMCENIAFLNRNYADYPLWTEYCGSGTCNDKQYFRVIGD